MGSLEIIIGPMFAGKSTELIQRIRKLKILNKSYLVLKPIIDNRYSDTNIVSHDNEKENCVSFDSLDNFINLIDINSFDTIFIDEGQFFKDLKSGVLKIVEKFNKNVVVTGLDGDFNRNEFGEILKLIPYCDKCKKITSLCVFCNDMTPALFSHKISGNNNQIEVGTNIYKPVCRKHYLEFI